MVLSSAIEVGFRRQYILTLHLDEIRLCPLKLKKILFPTDCFAISYFRSFEMKSFKKTVDCSFIAGVFAGVLAELAGIAEERP